LKHFPSVILSSVLGWGADLGECVVDGFLEGADGPCRHEQVTCEMLFVGVSRLTV
jgi:hypothetical protein